MEGKVPGVSGKAAPVRTHRRRRGVVMAGCPSF
jgi:hypothetical protein